ncbi:MAG: type 4a pilus biogenesis protein PilO [Candidatus Omnitrophica bacterium]|nr:type 4a pilus biogenesis protein PilO [Candidatus Omnitrophota bacterium]
MINKFISGLSANEKKILSVTALFVLLALFDRLLVGPSLNRMKELDESISKEEDTIKQNMRFLGYRERIVKEASTFKDFYTQDVRSEDEITADFLKKLELMGTQSKVELSKISPAAQQVNKEYVKYIATMECSGKLEDITAFVYAINNSTELIKVEKMVLAGNTRNADTVQASLTVSKMIVGADPAVDAKKLVRTNPDAAAGPELTKASGNPDQKK